MLELEDYFNNLNSFVGEEVSISEILPWESHVSSGIILGYSIPNVGFNLTFSNPERDLAHHPIKAGQINNLDLTITRSGGHKFIFTETFGKVATLTYEGRINT